MRPKKVTVSSVAASAWLPVDYKQAPMNLSIGCVLVSGTATFSAEYTFDDVFDSSVTPVAFAVSTISGATASAVGVINQPVRAIRLNVTAGASPVVAMTMIQGQR